MINIEKTGEFEEDVKDEDVLIRFVISKDNKCHLWWDNKFGVQQVFGIIYWQIVVASIKAGINIFKDTNN